MPCKNVFAIVSTTLKENKEYIFDTQYKTQLRFCIFFVLVVIEETFINQKKNIFTAESQGLIIKNLLCVRWASRNPTATRI